MKLSLLREIAHLSLSLMLAASVLLTGVIPRTYASTGEPITTVGDAYGIHYFDGYIYAALRNSGIITRTPVSGNSDSEVVVTGTGASFVMAVAVNSAGDLFYTRDSNNRIYKIAASALENLPVDASAAEEYMMLPGTYLYAMAFDAENNLYVSSKSTGTDASIYKIAQDKTATEVLAGSAESIYGLAFSSAGDLYIQRNGNLLSKVAGHELETADEPAVEPVPGTSYVGGAFGIAILPDGEIVYSNISATIRYLNYVIPLSPPGIELVTDPIIAIDPARVNDTVSVVASVYSLGSKPVTSRGVQYRPYTEAGTESWVQVPYEAADPQTKGSFTSVIAGLQWQQEYELRGYATNEIDTSYTGIKRFVLDDDPTMDEPDVRFDRVGPSVLHVKDKKRIIAFGDGVTNLLRKPLTEIDYYVKKGSDTVPLAYNIINNHQLELTWDADLDPGSYEVHLIHDTYTDYVLVDDPLTEEEWEGLTLINTDFYKPRNFERIDVPGTSAANELDSLSLQGPFTETPVNPGVYTLSDTSEVVTLNGTILFQGSSLVVDKSGGDGKTVITGNGRLYVNSSMQQATASNTLHNGPFSFTSDNFSVVASGGAKADYLRLSMPVKIDTFTFVKGGLNAAGQLELSVTAGKEKISGTISVNTLQYRNNRFDLAGTYSLNKTLKVGPLNVDNTKFVIDTRSSYVSVSGKGSLPGSGISFDVHMKVKQGRLDGISFDMFKKTNLASTGLRVDYLYGTVSNLAGKTEIPQQFRVNGPVNDIRLHCIRTVSGRPYCGGTLIARQDDQRFKGMLCLEAGRRPPG